MKRVLSMLLCLLMLLSVGAAAFAEEIPDAAAAEESTEQNTEDTQSGVTGNPSGLIDEEYLQKIISEYAANNGMEKGDAAVSVGYCYTKTGDTWFYNGDAWYYSASLYKVPITMLLEEKERAGEIDQSTMISNQYSTGSVETMEHNSIVYSDNNTGHAIVEYLGGTYNGKCTDQTIKLTGLPQEYFPQSFYDYSYYSAKYYTEILKTLYYNQDMYPHVIPYMKEATTYEQTAENFYFLSRSIDYEVAQKYGSHIENGGEGDDNKHAGGIVYTPNPVIITVMTKNVFNWDTKIGDIASLLVDYTLQLDTKVEEYQKEQERLAREAEEAAAQAEKKRLEEEAAAQAEAERKAEEQRQNEQLAKLRAEQAEKKSKISKTLTTVVVIVVILLALFVLLKKKFGAKLPKLSSKRYDDYDDDYGDDDDDDYYRPKSKPARSAKPAKASKAAPKIKRYEYDDEDEFEDEDEESEDDFELRFRDGKSRFEPRPEDAIKKPEKFYDIEDYRKPEPRPAENYLEEDEANYDEEDGQYYEEPAAEALSDYDEEYGDEYEEEQEEPEFYDIPVKRESRRRNTEDDYGGYVPKH